jgi:hypothetical protein
VSALGRWLFRPVNVRALAAVRIAIGSYGLVWLLFSSPELLGLGGLDRARFDPVGIVAVSGAGPMSTRSIAFLLAGTIAAAAAVVAGWRFRVTGPAFAIGLLWLTTYQNSWSKLLHSENLLVIHALVLAVSPAADAWAVRRRGGERAVGVRDGWPLRAMALATVGSYVLAGVAKLRNAGWAWFDPENLRNWLAYDLVRKELFGDPYLPVALPALRHPWLLLPAVVATIAVELGAPVALVGRRWAWRWCLAAWSFHVAVVLSMSVVFPYELVGLAYLPVLLATAGAGDSPTSRRELRRRDASAPATSAR